jgi:hypothetical protein
MYPSLLHTRSATLTPPGDSPMVRFADRMLAGQPAGVWRRGFDDMWCHLRPAGARGPEQGWKLHLSASTGAAMDVLGRALEVLLADLCPLKFAASPDRHALLNSAHYPRGGAGKFMTVYPRDLAQFCSLAERLDAATDGLVGPRILSDRPYRPGSVVHYRYGAFTRKQQLSNDAERVLLIAAPDGRLVEDRRDAWFSPPSWAPEPFPRPPGPAAPARPVVLAGRFVAREAVRQSNRGGVYRATDLESGREVIVKQARRGVLGNTGEDAQDTLRRETTTLTELAPLGLTPAVRALFEQDGDLFLAQETVDGEPLRKWIRRHARVIGPRTPNRPGVAWSVLVRVLRRLVDVLDRVHEAGWTLCDLTPSNVMVTGSDTVRLVDLESAVRMGAREAVAGTPGYAAPEQHAIAGAAATTDLYSLGAIVFAMAAGIDPPLRADAPARAWPAGMVRWLEALARESSAAGVSRALPLVRGLAAERPDDRWSLTDVRAHLAQAATQRPETARPAAAELDLDRLIEDGVAHLAATAASESSDWYWPGTCTVGSVDRCNVQHGSAGVLSVLTRAMRHDVPGATPGLLAESAAWTRQELAAESVVRPGLYFGVSGTAWALYDAAVALSDEELAEAARHLARRVPDDWPNPDVAHGLAGAGLAQLRLAQLTGRAEFRDRAEHYGELLAERAVRARGELTWPVPSDFASRLAGVEHYGFAHGVAGIGCFLAATGRADLLDLADEAGRTLCAAAVRHGPAALWPTNAGAVAVPDPAEHWCSGASGVGTFLTQLWQITGTGLYRELAEAAAHAVWRRRWYASAVACHGLAGNGQFLLDLAEATGEDRFRAWATGLARLIGTQAIEHGGRRLLPDETRAGFGVEYGVGMSGVLDFLLRLRHGGPRSWMPVLDPNLRRPSGPPRDAKE